MLLYKLRCFLKKIIRKKLSAWRKRGQESGRIDVGLLQSDPVPWRGTAILPFLTPSTFRGGKRCLCLEDKPPIKFNYFPCGLSGEGVISRWKVFALFQMPWHKDGYWQGRRSNEVCWAVASPRLKKDFKGLNNRFFAANVSAPKESGSKKDEISSRWTIAVLHFLARENNKLSCPIATFLKKKLLEYSKWWERSVGLHLSEPFLIQQLFFPSKAVLI